MRLLAVTWVMAAGAGVLLGCGGSSTPTVPPSDRASIMRASRNYFLRDATPDPDTYCTSYVELQRSDNFRAGSLVEDADRTESRCRGFFDRISVRPTGMHDAKIKRIEIDGDRGHVMVTFRFAGRETFRNAWVGKVAGGDWRILNAGYD
jgi:hypothetical protein